MISYKLTKQLKEPYCDCSIIFKSKESHEEHLNKAHLSEIVPTLSELIDMKYIDQVIEKNYHLFLKGFMVGVLSVFVALVYLTLIEVL